MAKNKLLHDELSPVIQLFIPEAEVERIEPIVTGHINKTYKVDLMAGGQRQSVLVQNLNTHVFKNPGSVMHNIVRCAHYLERLGKEYPYEVLTPYALHGSSSHLYQEGKSAWRMFNYVANTISLDQIETNEQAREIGEAFGVFLAKINQDDPEEYQVTIPDFHNFTKRYNLFTKYLEGYNSDSLDEKSRRMISEIHQYAPQFIQLESMHFPVRIAHHDTKANNVLLDRASGKTRAIIDLDTLMPGDVFSDFGDLIRTVLNPYDEDQFPDTDKKVSLELYSSLMNGFLPPLDQVLTNDEKENLIVGGKKIILLQVIRFLEDHLRGDEYYQVRYQGHNLDRAYSQMNLYKAISNTELFVQ